MRFLPRTKLREAFQALWKQEEGRIVFHYLFRVGHIYRNTFDKDPLLAAFKAGQREMALLILSQLQADDRDLSNLMEQSRNYLIGGDNDGSTTR